MALAQHSLRTLGRWRLKKGVQGVLREQPLLADFDRGKLSSLNLFRHTTWLNTQTFGGFSRGVMLGFAHIEITPLH
jgi:hypothetical protein